MFIQGNRYTTKSGEERMSYSLAEIQNVDGKSRKRTLLNLGQEFALPRENWSQVSTLVRESFDGQSSVELEFNSTPVAMAARQIIRRLHAAGYRAESSENPYKAIAIQRIDYPPNAIRSVGAERLTLRALELLGLDDSLENLNYSPISIRLAKASVIARMLKPSSRPIAKWIQQDSALLELLDLESHPVTATRLRNVAQKLWPVRGQVLRGLKNNSPQSDKSGADIRCRDLTNEYGKPRESAMIIFMLNEQGEMCGSKLLRNPQQYLNSTRRIKYSKDILIVTPDFISDRLLHRWTRSGIRWLCVNLNGSRAQGSAGSEKFDLANFNSELRLYAVSSRGQPVEEIEEECLNFETALTELDANLSMPYRPSKYRTIQKHIAALRDQYHRASDRYEVHLSRGKAEKVVAISFKRVGRAQHGSSLNRYILRTNLMDWDKNQLSLLYHRLTENRRIIRALDASTVDESDSRYHSLDAKKAYWTTTILAFMAVQLMEKILREKGIEAEWGGLRRMLAPWERITSILTSSNSDMYLEHQDTRIDSALANIAAAMGVKPARHLKRSKYRF